MIALCWAVSVALFASGTAPSSTAAPFKGGLSDFLEYWSAARVHASGGNPYSAAELLPIQREATGDAGFAEALMLWTPPWTLPLYQPLSWWENPHEARAVWLEVQRFTVVLSVLLVWLTYFRPWFPSPILRLLCLLIPLVVLVRFAPFWWLLVYGQATGFVLLGLAGFLFFRQRGYPIAAGMMVSLTAMKPHLLLLFGLVLVLDATTRSGRRALFAGIGTLVVFSLIAMIPNPRIFHQFVESITQPPSAEAPSVTQWHVPLISNEIRRWLRPDGGSFWIQWIPILLGAVGTLIYWWRKRTVWNWADETPMLVLASCLLAPYGTWIFDLVVLLVPVVALFARLLSKRAWLALGLAAAGLWVIYPYSTQMKELHDSLWFTPAIVGWYVAVLVSSRMIRHTPAPTPTTIGSDNGLSLMD